MIRSLLRGAGRRVFGPALFDALAQFRRLPLRAAVVEEAAHRRCVFIEPHFDDAIFSCGGVFAALAQKRSHVELVTVFTADPDPGQPLSPLAKQIHAGWKTERAPYEQRRKEGAEIENHPSVALSWLDIPEALYRNSKFDSFDQLMQQEGPPTADPAYQTVEARLEQIFSSEKSTTIFAPLGVGGHPDHRVVHAAVRTLARRRPNWTVWYYEDFPYVLDPRALKSRINAHPDRLRPTIVDVRATLDRRVQLGAGYASQVAGIFGTPERMRHEMVGYAGRVGTPTHPCERFWGS